MGRGLTKSKDSISSNGTSTPKTKLKSVTRGNPCPVCGGHRRCSIGADGLLSCHVRQGEQPGFVCLGAAKRDSAFTLYRRQDDAVLQVRKAEWKARQGNGHAANNAALDWGKLAADYQTQLAPERRDELGEILGVPVPVLESLGIGWDGRADCWAFPETNARGQIIGIGLRRRDGTKFQVTGGRRGLHVPRGWLERGGPLLLPEGASNTLALTALGLSAIGRPSNLSGVEHLAQLLVNYPIEQDVIVIGDFDPKPSGAWPGLAGCQQTAAQLQEKLGRKVCWVLPPGGSKDVRAWTNERTLPMDCADSWDEAGEHLLADLQSRKKEPILQQPSPDAVSNEPPAPRYRFRTSAEFLQGDYRPEWLVKRLMVRGQPGVIGGPKKSLKTTLLVELAYSLASGAAFLGRFEVPAQLCVGIMSGESGEFTLKETALRIAAAKGIDANSANVLWEFTLPRLACGQDLGELQAAIREAGVQVLLIDPLYLCVLSGVGAGGLSASNLFQMGPLFLAVARTCLDAGCTPILAHHFRLTRPNPHDEPQLEDLAFAGIQEFARQWLLVGRRERYEPGSGQHKLWLTAGGSMGQSELWALDIDEGQLHDDFGGRQWCVSVETATESRQEKSGAAERQKQEKKRLDESKEEQRVLSVICQMNPGNQGVGFTSVRDACGFSSNKMNAVVFRMIQNNSIEEIYELEADIGSKAKRKVRGLRRVVAEEN